MTCCHALWQNVRLVVVDSVAAIVRREYSAKNLAARQSVLGREAQILKQSAYVCMYVCVYSMHVCVQICLCVCMYVCVCVYIYIYIYMCVCVCIYIYIYIYIYR